MQNGFSMKSGYVLSTDSNPMLGGQLQRLLFLWPHPTFSSSSEEQFVVQKEDDLQAAFTAGFHANLTSAAINPGRNAIAPICAL